MIVLGYHVQGRLCGIFDRYSLDRETAIDLQEDFSSLIVYKHYADLPILHVY